MYSIIQVMSLLQILCVGKYSYILTTKIGNNNIDLFNQFTVLITLRVVMTLIV